MRDRLISRRRTSVKGLSLLVMVAVVVDASACPPIRMGLEGLIEHADQAVLVTEINVQPDHPRWLRKLSRESRKLAVKGAAGISRDLALLADEYLPGPIKGVTSTGTARVIGSYAPSGPEVGSKISWDHTFWGVRPLAPETRALVFLAVDEFSGKLEPVRFIDGFSPLLVDGPIAPVERILRSGFESKDLGIRARESWRQRAVFEPQARRLMIAPRLVTYLPPETLERAILTAPGGLWTDLDVVSELAGYESEALDAWAIEMADALVDTDGGCFAKEAIYLVVQRWLRGLDKPWFDDERLQNREKWSSLRQTYRLPRIPPGELTEIVVAWQKEVQRCSRLWRQ